MKKVIAIVLALVVALSCSAMAFATTNTCSVCGFKYDSETEYDNHLSGTRHQDAVKASATTATYTCKTCGAVYTDTTAYNAHIASHTTEATIVYKDCPYCGRAYEYGKAYNDHLDSHRGVEDEGDQLEYYFDKYIAFNGSNGITMSISDLFDRLISQFDSIGVLGNVNDLITRVYDYVESIVYDVWPDLKSKLAGEAAVAGAISDLEGKVAELGLGSNSTISSLIAGIKAKIKSFYAGEKAVVEEITEAEATANTGSSSLGIVALSAVCVASAAAFVCTRKKED